MMLCDVQTVPAAFFVTEMPSSSLSGIGEELFRVFRPETTSGVSISGDSQQGPEGTSLGFAETPRLAHLLPGSVDASLSALYRVDLSASFTPAVALLDPTIQRSIDRQSGMLKELVDDWDGEGAVAIPPDRIESLRGDLRTILTGYKGPLVDLAPGSDGSVQAEWRLPGGLEFYYGIDQRGDRYFVKYDGKQPQEFSGELARYAARLAIVQFLHQGSRTVAI
jgi:hypothetical protein